VNGSGFTRYILNPFSWSEASNFISNWFANTSVTGQSSPSERGQRFVRELIDGEIADLLLVPQLLSIAAVLYEISGGEKLPTKRSALFAELVRLLLAQAPTRGALDLVRAEWGNRMADGAMYAERFFSRRREILANAALRLQEGYEGSLEKVALHFARSNGWLPDTNSGLDEDWLLRAIGLVLRGTGLVTTRLERLEFVHQTFQEFLAVEGLTGGQRPDTKYASKIVQLWKQEPWRQVVLFSWDCGQMLME
jgi:hypothetical protein